MKLIHHDEDRRRERLHDLVQLISNLYTTNIYSLEDHKGILIVKADNKNLDTAQFEASVTQCWESLGEYAVSFEYI